MKKTLYYCAFMALAVCASASWAGDTGWYPVMYKEKARTWDEFLHDAKKGKMRLSANDFLAEIGEITGERFADMDSFANFFHAQFRLGDAEVRSCDFRAHELPAGFGIARVNNAGTVIDYGYTRISEGKPLCNTGEKILYYKGIPVLSLWCGNPVRWPVEEPIAIPLAPVPVITETVAEEPKKDVAPVVVLEPVCTKEQVRTEEKAGVKFSHGHGGFFGGHALLAVPPAEYATESVVTTSHWRLKCK